MAEEIKSLTLKINTQSVEEANRKLDEFSKKARNAAAATDDLTAAKKRASTVTAEELRDFERVYQNAIKSAKATRQAADEARKLALSRKQLADSADIYIEKLTKASKATKSFEGATKLASSQASEMYLQLMKGDFSGFQTSFMSMVMQNGVGNTFSTLLTSLNPLNIGVSAAISGGIELAKSYYKVSQELSNFNKIIISTGNYAGVTGDQLVLISKKISSEVGDTHEVVNALEAALSTNKFNRNWLEKVAMTAVLLQQSMDKNISETVDNFKRLSEDPLKASEELHAKYNYLTLAIYQQIAALQKNGDTQGAQELAMREYSNAMNKRANDINKNLGTLERMWNALSKAAGSAWDAMLNIGREDTLEDQIKREAYQLAFYRSVNYGHHDNPRFKKIEEQSEKEIIRLQLLKKAKEEEAKANSEISKVNSNRIESEKVLAFWLNVSKTNAEKKAEALKRFNEAVDVNRLAYEEDQRKEPSKREGVKLWPDEYKTKAIKSIDNLFEDKGNNYRSYSTSLLQASQQQEISLINQLNTLREQSSTLNTMTSERQKYFELQAQIEALENQSDKSKLTAQEKYILGHKEALLAQQEKNAALSEEIEQYQASIKALQQIREYTANIVSQSEIKQATFGMTSKQSNRANALIQLDKKEEGDLEKIKDPTEVAKITEEYTKAKQALEQSWQLEDQHEGDWFAGLKLGINEFAENGLNVFNGFRDIASNAMGSVSRSLTELVTTGKTDFKSLTKSILTNIIEIINKLLLAKAIQSAMGWLGGGAGGGAGAGAATGGLQQAYSGGLIYGYAKGGGVGYNNEPGGYTGNGNKYTPAGIVHKGEFVFTKESTKRIGVANLYALMREAQHGYADGGYVNVGHALPVAFVGKSSSPSNSVNVNTSVAINMQSNNSLQPQAGNINQNALEAQIKPIIQKNIGEALQRSTSPGGDLYILLNR